MKQSKFSWADTITVIITLAFGFVCFLSFNFFTLGDITRSIIFSAVITLLLGGFAIGATVMKRTNRNFKSCIITEWIFLFLFIVTAVITITPFIWGIKPFNHFFDITSQKTEIQSSIDANITQVEKLFLKYKNYAKQREEKYKERLESVVSAKENSSEYSNFDFEEGINDTTQIENKMETLHFQLFSSNFDKMETAFNEWFSKSKSNIKNWNPMGVVTIIRDMDIKTAEWLSELKKCSQYREKGEEKYKVDKVEDFNYELSFSSVNDKFKEGKTSIFAYFYAILGFALMMFSYIISKRNRRYPGLKIIFSKQQGTAINEL